MSQACILLYLNPRMFDLHQNYDQKNEIAEKKPNPIQLNPQQFLLMIDSNTHGLKYT